MLFVLVDRRFELGNSQPFNTYQDLLKVISKFLRNFYLGEKKSAKDSIQPKYYLSRS